jgi:hypothetical protein
MKALLLLLIVKSFWLLNEIISRFHTTSHIMMRFHTINIMRWFHITNYIIIMPNLNATAEKSLPSVAILRS